MTRTSPPHDRRGRPRLTRLLWAAAVLPAVCWAGGCVGPSRPAVDGIPVRRLPAEVLGPPRSGLQTVPLTLLRQREPGEYRVDRGDVLGVYAQDITAPQGEPVPLLVNPDPHAPPAARGHPATVQEDGTITLQGVATVRVSVRGLTLDQVREAIVRAITVDRQLIVPGEERVTVDLIRPRQYRVLVVREDCGPTPGELAACGDGKRGAGHTLMLEAYRNDLLEALNRTGGLPGPCAKAEVVIRRGHHDPHDPSRCTVRVPIRVHPGEPVPFTEADVLLFDGDTVYVEARDAEFYYATGPNGSVQVALPRDADVRVVEAIAKAGWSLPTKGTVTVLRRVGCGQQVPIRVDLVEALRDPRENILVQPGDVIVLPPCKECTLGHCFASKFRLPCGFGLKGPHHWGVGGCEPCGP